MQPSLMLALAMSVALLPTPSCAQRTRDRADQSQDVASRIDTTFAFGRSGIADLTEISGDVIVTAWDRAEARVRAFSERGRLRSQLSPSRITMEVERDRGRTGDSRVEVWVPVGVRVIAQSRSGDVTVRGTRGAVEASSTSGDIIVSDAADRIMMETLSGDVQASGLSGTVRAESVSGSVEIHDVNGEVRAETTSGDVSVTSATSRNVVATTVSGEVTYDGSIDANGRYEFRSHSGDIRLDIPENANANFSVETFSGSLDSDFAITIQPGQRATGRPRRFEFTLGRGGARITAESFSGDVVIGRRARTGR